MKCTKIELVDGRTVITTESPRWFRKPLIRKFLATHRLTESFWSWCELPYKLTVSDRESFQLDLWKRESAVE